MSKTDIPCSYEDWQKSQNISELTNTQYRFAQWLFQPENVARLEVIGDIDSIFKSIRKYVKSKQ